MKVVTFILIAFYLLSYTASAATESKPYGLLTDLMEHTDRTWSNGYSFNLPIWQKEAAIEPVQYVEIASTHPSFSWIVPGSTQETRQTAYHIIVSDSYENAMANKGNIWDSGITDGDQSTALIYPGPAFQPNKNYFWRVKTITNTEGESKWSDVKAFHTADTLSEYAASAYPIVKTMEYPTAINAIEDKTTFIDFGKAAFGQILLTLTSDADENDIIIHLGEAVDNGRVDRKPGGTIRYQSYTLRLMKGTHTYRIKIRRDGRNTGPAAILMPDYIGEVLPFRYCEIENYPKPISATDVMRESAHYPFDDMAASFECSDAILNQIWDLCKYSIKATSFTGIYVDGDRERIPYEADALINQLCHYGVDREYSMARRSHEYLLQRPTWPTEWILQALIIAWNDYLYTGDSRSLKANYDILQARTLMQLREENGLISTTTGLQTTAFSSSIRFKGQIKDIVDWPHTGILGLNKAEGGEADGFVFTDYNTVTNAFHYEALKIMEKIAGALDRDQDVSFYRTEADSFKKRFNQTFFNQEKGYYVDGATTDHASLHANMLPIAFDMVPPENKIRVIDFIQSRGMACSVYGSQFLMDALYAASSADYALSMLTKTDDRSWYNMIRVGSTISLEAWDNKYKPNQDWNHAWGAVPANIIPRKLMGVEPLAPGFSVARIKPQLGSLSWANASIPTIKGEIVLKIENKKNSYALYATIPANMEAEVYLPLPETEYEVYKNGSLWQATRVENEPFLYVGKLPSGTYKLTVNTR